jgi:hypothetical protein
MALAPQVPERVLEREARMTQSRPLLGPVRWARTLVQKTLSDFDLQPHRDRPALWAPRSPGPGPTPAGPLTWSRRCRRSTLESSPI